MNQPTSSRLRHCLNKPARNFINNGKGRCGTVRHVFQTINNFSGCVRADGGGYVSVKELAVEGVNGYIVSAYVTDDAVVK